jgi:hypothetical protein
MKKPPAQAGQSPQNPTRKKFHVLRKTGKVLLISLGIIIAIPVLILMIIFLLSLPTLGWYDFWEKQPAPPSSQILLQYSIGGNLGGGSSESDDYNQLILVQSQLTESELEAYYEPGIAKSNSKFGGEDTDLYIYTIPDLLDDYRYFGIDDKEIRQAVENQLKSYHHTDYLWAVMITKTGRNDFFN